MPETVHDAFDLEVTDACGGIELAELYWALVGYRAVLPFPEERAGDRVIGPDDVPAAAEHFFPDVPARGVGAIVGRKADVPDVRAFEIDVGMLVLARLRGGLRRVPEKIVG